MQKRKTVGVLGGMGPAATVELFSTVINNTNAHIDQEHVSMIIINDTQIPDRTEYILGKGPSPVPRLIDNLNKLYYAGADVAVIPCMTAHTFIPELQMKSPIPIINAINLVEAHLNELYPENGKVGLLATTGSVQSGVFQRYISKEICIPEIYEQEDLMTVIYGNNGIKAGNTSPDLIRNINNIIDKLRKEKIQAVIAGCTELSIVMNEKNVKLPVIDPILLLAKEAIRVGSFYSIGNVT